MSDLLSPGQGGVRGLIPNPRSVRTRLRAGGPGDAIWTGYDYWTPIDFYFSDLRDDYLGGRIKLVRNVVRTMNAVVHSSYSIVHASRVDRLAGRGAEHRRLLLDELAAQYKSAVVRAIGAAEGMHKKQMARIRHRANTHFGSIAPSPADVAAYFAAWPEALDAAREIGDLWTSISEGAQRRGRDLP